MRLLLDTRVLLWAVGHPARLGVATQTLIEDVSNEVLFSAASIWEIAIKAGLGRADFTVDPDSIDKAARETDFTELPISAAVAASVVSLPPHHRDPFDRLLVALAIAGPLRLYTADPQLPPYSELVTLIA